ncbi:hypothetical protein F5Y06DRAFT_283009 [Hypoxylon sp. FL0890]|nr:hypothetical protein F5Y06DRAFT_283009 [Hypoxylon sp. FL0890]
MATQGENHEMEPQAAPVHASNSEPPNEQAFPSRCSETSTTQAAPGHHGVLRKVMGEIAKRGATVLGILSLIIACIALWPSVTAANDGHHAERLAEWTARKDFLEICEQHNWTGSDCEMSQGEEIGAPPDFHRTDWKRDVNHVPRAEGNVWCKQPFYFLAFVIVYQFVRRDTYIRERKRVLLALHFISIVLYPFLSDTLRTIVNFLVYLCITLAAEIPMYF